MRAHTHGDLSLIVLLLAWCSCWQRIIDTFAIFDVDGSGTIDSKELEGLIQMIIPNPHPMLVQEMVAELDTNKDGEVDLWEVRGERQELRGEN